MGKTPRDSGDVAALRDGGNPVFFDTQNEKRTGKKIESMIVFSQVFLKNDKESQKIKEMRLTQNQAGNHAGSSPASGTHKEKSLESLILWAYSRLLLYFRG